MSMKVGVAAFATAVSLLGTAAVASAQGPVVIDAPASGYPQALSGTGDGDVWLASGGPQKITRYAPDGRRIGPFAFQPDGSVGGIAALPGGDLVIGKGGNDGSAFRAGRYGPDGTPRWTTNEPIGETVALFGERVLLTQYGQPVTIHSVALADGSMGPSLSYPEPANVIGMAALPGGSLLATSGWHPGGGIARVFEPDGSHTRRVDLAASSVAAGQSSLYLARFSSQPYISRIDEVAYDGKVRASFDVSEYFGEVLEVALSGRILWAAGRRPLVSSDTRLIAIPLGIPMTTLSVARDVVEAGETVVFDASATRVAFGSVASYEWDLDGDGAFERNSGTTAQAEFAYPDRGVRTVTVRATSDSGDQRAATVRVDVRATPPSRIRGVSINAGARFTNDPRVVVSMRWPRWATEFHLSNDGGFASVMSGLVEPSVSWTLDSSGPERLPKTIYARFSGGEAGNETYQDDIILDQTPPSLASVVARPITARSRARQGSAARARARKVRLAVRAKDATSGVVALQITERRKAPGARLPYRTTITRTTRAATLHVRAWDAAGNASRWRTVRVAADRRRR